MTLVAYEGISPAIDNSVFIAHGAVLIGKVTLEAESSVWFNAVLRADNEPIVVGPRSNIQDGAVCHTDPGYPCIVGSSTTVGHNAILHGCKVGSGVTIGMGATVLNGACIGDGALVAANALVLEGFEVPERTLVAGVPAKIMRELSVEDAGRGARGADGYVRRSLIFLQGGASDIT